MKLSYNWLSEFIDLSQMKIAELADLLTMKTCEVDGYHEARPDLENFQVALVKKVTKHPNAEKLRICEVFDGKQSVQVVTGAPNVEENKKYPLAPVGVTMPGGLEIKPAKLRGVDSNGMLCSAGELDLESFMFNMNGPEDGLFTLPDEMEAGESIRNAFCLNDFILDIDNKSITHRPDLWSHFGFAREIASLTGLPLKSTPDYKVKEDDSVDARLGKVGCKIEGKAAIVYSGANLENIRIVPSPIQTQARLYLAGMRPINNVVDISNYVMLEIGQPNHAFDRGKIANSIEVEFSTGKEKLQLLDDRNLEVPKGLVLIKNGGSPVALAGVMGGKSSEVDNGTVSLFLESATFHRKDIRKAVATTGIRTESSQRFEKGQNPENSFMAIGRFAVLLEKTCPELKLGKIYSNRTEEFRENKIETSVSFIKQKLGTVDLDERKIESILTSLGMKCHFSQDKLTVEVPVYRSYFDLEIEEDLVEEIGRVIGYNQVQPEPLFVSCTVPAYYNQQRAFEHELRNLMAKSYQFTEVYNYAFQSKDEIELDQRYSAEAVKLKNPIHQELDFMRTSPLTGLLGNIVTASKRFRELRYFELERIFLPKPGAQDEKSLPEERYFLAGIFYSEKEAAQNLEFLSSLVSNLLSHSGAGFYELVREPLSEAVFHPSRAGQVLFAGNTVAKWGEIHPAITNKFHISQRLYYFEVFIKDLLNIRLKETESGYVPVFKYPPAEFEFTVLMDERALFSDLSGIVGKPEKISQGKTALESFEHLTTYSGESIAKGKKAVSVKVRWRNPDRTIQHEELKKLQDELISNLEKSGFHLRS